MNDEDNARLEGKRRNRCQKLDKGNEKQTWSAFKLGDPNDDEVPNHVESLINNTIVERWKLIESNDLLTSDYPLECDLVCCLALVVGLEEGFRIDQHHRSSGFDIRVLRSLSQMPPNRMRNKTVRISLVLPSVLDLQFNLIVIPVVNDYCILNFLAMGKNPSTKIAEILTQSKVAIYIPKYLTTINQACARLYNLKSLSFVLRPIFQDVMQTVMSYNNCQHPATFLGLPEELKKYIFKFLTAREFLALTSANASLYSNFALDNGLWKYYLKRDMKIGDVSGVNPLQAYKAWYRRGPQEGRRSNLAAPQPHGSNNRPPIRSISEVSSASSPTTHSQRSQRMRSTTSEWEF